MKSENEGLTPREDLKKSERDRHAPFEITPNVYVTRDANNVVRHLRHLQEPYFGSGPQSSRELSAEYLGAVAGIYGIDNLLAHLDIPPSDTITDSGTEVRYFNEKSLMRTDTVSYVQTHFGLPIWEAGVSVIVQNEPRRVTSSQSTVHEQVNITRPADNAKCVTAALTPMEFVKVLGVPVGSQLVSAVRTQGIEEFAESIQGIEINDDTRLLIYRYDAEDRYARTTDKVSTLDKALTANPPTLPLRPVPESIRDQTHYVVREVLFTLALRNRGRINWRAFMEVETCAILYLRAFVSAWDGNVFPVDPPTASGVMAIAPPGNWAKIVELPGLSGTYPQRLKGDYIELADLTLPHIPAPNSSTPGAFIFDPAVSPNDFTAVSAYYHCDDAFRMVEGMHFDMTQYFNGTQFPVKVDHRASVPTKTDSCAFGDCVNASTNGNRYNNGVESFCFALMSPTKPVGIAADKRAVLHEFGHALLLDSIGSANLGFAHSVGDSLAAIHCDPASQLADRFMTFPWISNGLSTTVRRHDRALVMNWGWGGTHDDGGYQSEQILSTTLFRAYLAAGGNASHPDPAVQASRRRFAARHLTYLIVRGIGSLPHSASTPTATPHVFATALMEADIGQPAFEGRPGGTMNKVISWAFEKQGLDRLPGACVTDEGIPAVDVYIDDGRDGEYTDQENFWSSRDIWNRLNNDGGTAHETPIVGQTNYVYVRVKNCGAQQATNVVVKAYHAPPAAGLVWKNDWTEMTLDPAAVANAIPPGGSDVVGPFKWIPNVNGHECLLATVSAAGDLSNVDQSAMLPCGVGPTPDWQLVPFDNNIAQRNVAPVPGGGGKKNLVAALKGRTFRVKNPYDYPAHVSIESTIPLFLENLGWHMEFDRADTSFTLPVGDHRDVPVHLVPRSAFSHADVTQPGGNPEIELRALIDGQLIGGITYEIDPNMKKPAPE